MAIVKEVELKIDAKQATKTLDQLGGSFEDVYGEVQPLSGRIGELEDRLYEMALAGQQNTKEFKDLTREIGSMKKVILQTDLVVDGMSQTMAQNLGGAIGGVTSGFTLAQGAMAAFGVESEAIEETLLRVQSALAISEGFEGIRQAVPSFKALSNSVKDFGANAISAFKGATNASKAFMLTGIGAIIGGITLLIQNWDSVTEAIGLNTEATKRNTAIKEASNKVASEAIANAAQELSTVDRLQKVLKDENVSRKEKNAAIKEAQKEYPNLIGNLNAENATLDELNGALKLYASLAELKAKVDAAQSLRTEEYKTQLENQLAAQKRQNLSMADAAGVVLENANSWDILSGNYKKIVKDKKVLEGIDKTAKENLKEQNKITESTINFLDKEIGAYEKEIKLLEDSLGIKEEVNNNFVDKQAEIEAELARQREEARQAEIQAELDRQTVLDEIAEAEYLATTSQIEQEINAVQDKYFRLIELAKQYGQDTSVLEAEQAKQIQAIKEDAAKQEAEKQKTLQQELADAMVAIKQEQLKEEEEALSARKERERKIIEGGFEFLSNLSAAFSQGNERQQKIAFNITKAANIAQATMDTYKAAQGAYASFATIPVVGVPLGIAAAGAAIAAGIANINAIKNTQFEGGGGAVSAGTTSSSPTAAGGFPAQFNVVGNSGVNQLAQSLGDQPLKAYVVSGDVTTAQSLERNKIEQSTI
jgi:hypothetical protein